MAGMRQSGKRARLPGRKGSSNCSLQDSPFMDWTNTFLESLDISKGDKEKIYSGNAEKIVNL